MSSEPTSLPTASAAATASAGPTAVPTASTVRRPRFDQRYLAPLFITVILLSAHFFYGVLVDYRKTLLAIGVAMLVEVVCGLLVYRKVPNLASAYITGISVGILLRSEGAWWPMAFCAGVSILSKYVIRVGDRHLWNPSNFGIAVTLIVASEAAHTLSKEFSNSLPAMVLIWALGSFIIGRLKRFHICAVYVVSFLAFAGVRALITNAGVLEEVGPITGPMYQLFIFFMITDPKTTVKCKTGQMIVAFAIAAMECALRMLPFMERSWGITIPQATNLAIHAPYFALFLVGPAANAVEMILAKRQAKPAVGVPA